ncbi:TonB-dependent receptor [Janthinobacterium fluminis]|uniref:TonB-dependent receptor n=1 Tax=Janthinobacterium fluminis TaxID=2987524 RepID=A0ABT5JXJ1_9BURK|nr:TonB-dependent receptor [Janthinobacterium fluminis]MDC8757289.1 TonB-dependent receptor [Janthinobacterium fluminis]
MTFKLTPLALAVSAALAAAAPGVRAQGIATEQQLQTVTINSSRAPLDRNLPSTTASKTQEQLRQQQNIFNPEDALRNLPSMTIRKRYSGDRNALIGGRSFATSQAPRALVLMDGYLISNFLGRFDAPRWNMLAPEEIARVDVLYGPFSAIYPGNSIGTTIAVTTTRPRQFEGAARVAAQFQDYDAYGLKGRYNNYQASALIGDRLASGLWYRLMANHQDATSQPMQYYTVNADSAGVFAAPAGGGPAVPVSGVLYDTAPTGQRRAVFGANAGAIDHTRQNTFKATFGYDFGPGLAAEGFLAWWGNQTATRNQSLLRDAAGNTVWSGRVSNGGNVFVVPAAAFAPYTRDERHLQGGVTVKTRNRDGWNASLVASRYAILADVQRNAAGADPVAAGGGAGNAVLRDGTGFQTLELQSTYTPVAGDWTGGAHALTVGLHANEYKLKQSSRKLPDWRVGADGESQFVGGETSLLALYAQDAWRFAPRWKVTAGLRAESWRATDGVQRIVPGATQQYAGQRQSAWSPKLSLAWEAAPDLSLRLSAGRGTRFATVTELYQGTQSGSSIVVNDPNLRPEKSKALELFAERRFDNGSLRASLYQDDIRDTIWSQQNLAVFPIVTNVQNVGRVRSRGLELAGQVDELGVKGLSLEANIAFSRSTILENAGNPATVGKTWVRIPRVRSATVLTYAPGAAWSASATYRYSGRQFNEMDNADFNPDTYGGLSRQKQLDLRLLLRLGRGVELSAGIDNVNDNRAYQGHPFPGRTLFTEVRYAF